MTNMLSGNSKRLRWLNCLCFAVLLCGGAVAADLQSSHESLAEYSAELRQTFPDIPIIPAEEVAARDEDLILLDVRDAHEFAVSHLPGAHRVVINVAAQLQDLGAVNETPIVVYCSVGYRSAALARDLRKLGFTNVRNLDGSIFGWANAGRELVNADGTTRGVHPFDAHWGRYLDRSKWQWEPDPSPDP